mgnify:CR=1 FL=1
MFRSHRAWSLLQPARPRHPIVRALLWIVGAATLMFLLIMGAVIGACVLLGSMLMRAVRPSRPVPMASRPADDPSVIDGDFTVLKKPLHRITNH